MMFSVMYSLEKHFHLEGTDYKDESIVAFLGGGSLSWFNKKLLIFKSNSFIYLCFR